MVKKIEELFFECLERGKEGKRGIRKTKPNFVDAGLYMNKAKHNLDAMISNKKNGYLDWAVIIGYYAMYHAILSVLSSAGIVSKDHTCSTAALEYLFVRKGKLESEFVENFKWVTNIAKNLEQAKLEKKYIDIFQHVRRTRETAQYNYRTSVRDTVVDKVMKDSREFVARIEDLLDEIKEGNHPKSQSFGQ